MTTDGKVQLDRPEVRYGDIATSAAVRAQTWADMAALAHWVAGRGTMLVPQHRCMIRLDSSGTDSATLRYKIRPQGRAIARVWVLELRGHTGFPGIATVQPLTLPSPVSTPVSVAPESYGTRMAPIVIVEGAGVDDELTRTVSDTEITCEVVATLGYVDVISCAVWELPRAALTQDVTDLAIAQDGYFPRRPIRTGDYEYVEGVWRLMASLSGARTRSGHVARWGPILEVATTSTTSLTEVDYVLVPGVDLPTDTTAALDAYLYAYCDGGTTGEWRVTTSSGSTSWQSITATAAAWHGPLAVTATAEDPSTTDGLRSSTYETLRIEVRRASGAGKIYVQGWSVLE